MQLHNSEYIQENTINRLGLVKSIMVALIEDGQSPRPESVSDFFELFESIEKGLTAI